MEPTTQTPESAGEISQTRISRKQRRREARHRRRERRERKAAQRAATTAAAPNAAITPVSEPLVKREKRSFLQQVEDVLIRIERGARELRSVANSAADAIEFGKNQVAEQKESASTLRNRATRLQKTGLMLAQLVLGYRLFGLRTAFSSPERTEILRDRLHADNAERFRRTSAEQGGAFLKVGQLLSARADLLPSIWVQELASLQDAAPTIPDAEARVALHTGLGAPPEQLFAEFDYQPLAAASIGQVHRARTLDGTAVAVKLQRPGVSANIEDDLALLDLSIDALRGSLPPIDLDTIIGEIRQHIRAELDYPREAQLTLRAARFFESIEGLRVPEPVMNLSSATVLTTHFIEGRKLTLVLDELCTARDAGDTAAQARLSEILGRLLQAYLRQMLELGMFQADPHPGNLMVTDSGDLVILDFGCAAELPDAVRRAYLGLMGAFFAQDRERMARSFETLGFRTRSGQPDTLVSFMEALLGELAEAVQTGNVRWPDREAISARAQGLGRSLADDPVVTVPGHFVMIGRVLATIGGLFSHYRPDLDVAVHVLPVLAATLGDATE